MYSCKSWMQEGGGGGPYAKENCTICMDVMYFFHHGDCPMVVRW